MKQLRIAMLCVHTSPLASLGGKKTGGMNVYVRDLCLELGRRGIQVDVFTRIQGKNTPHVQVGGDNFRVISVAAGTPRFIRPADVEPHLEQFVDGVIAYAEEENITYDVIHGHYWLSGIAAGKLRAKWGRSTPIIQMFHTLGAMKNQIAPTPEHRAPQSRIDGETRVIQEIADHLIAATPAEQAQLIDLYGADRAKISVIPPGTDTERFTQIRIREARQQLGLKIEQKIVLFVGRIEPLKGIDTFLEAAHIIDQQKTESMRRKHNVKFIIIGGQPHEWPHRPEFRRLFGIRNSLRLNTTVDFVGAKEQDELPLWYSAADIVAMPSHYESFGLVALEAMMMGTPVVASRVGGLAHLVVDGETGYLVEARAAEQLAERLDLILSDNKLRRKLSKQAYKHAQSYNWTHIADRIVELYTASLSL